MEKYVLNSAEKLDAIYQILQEGESRRKRASLYRLIKWIIIFAIMYLVITRPDMIIGRITETLKPLILSTASGMIATQKEELSNTIKNLLPPGIELQ